MIRSYGRQSKAFQRFAGGASNISLYPQIFFIFLLWLEDSVVYRIPVENYTDIGRILHLFINAYNKISLVFFRILGASFNPLSDDPTSWVRLTILWGWRLKGQWVNGFSATGNIN